MLVNLFINSITSQKSAAKASFRGGGNIISQVIEKGADQFISSGTLKNASSTIEEKCSNAKKLMLNSLEKAFQHQDDEEYIKKFNFLNDLVSPVFENLSKTEIEHLPAEHKVIIRDFIHDLRNFGNFCQLITLNLQEMIEKGKPSSEIKSTFLKNCNAIYKKVNNDFEVCKLFLSKKNSDFASCFKSAEDSVNQVFNDKNINLTVENKELLSKIKTTQISDCYNFFNTCRTLLENAGKYTNEGGEVKVTFKEIIENNQKRLVATFKDSGIGILEEDFSKIFEAGQRGKNAGNIKGTGYGLERVRKDVKNLGGSIKIASSKTAGPDKGTTFEVSIPIEA